jgi:hypothetical protein
VGSDSVLIRGFPLGAGGWRGRKRWPKVKCRPDGLVIGVGVRRVIHRAIPYLLLHVLRGKDKVEGRGAIFSLSSDGPYRKGRG